jgi:competence ComEA-like helix-hairpin-helix protein
MRTQFFMGLTAVAVWMLLAGATGADTKTPPAPHSVDLNSATSQQLEELPGIGPTRANAILEFRKKNGRFRSVNDLLVVKGISRKELEKIRPYIVVKPVAPAKIPEHAPGQHPAPKPPAAAPPS